MPKLLSICFLVIILISLACKKQEITSQYIENEIMIDGVDSDWQNIPMQYIEKVGGTVGIANDSSNLYILFKFNDQNLARKIIQRGLVIWLDKSKKTGVRYRGSFSIFQSLPKRSENENRSRQPRSFDRGRMENLGAIMLINHDERALIRGNHPGEPQAASDIVDGTYCYEFAIPIGDSEENPFALEVNKNNKSNLGFEIGYIDPQKREEMMSRRSEMEGQNMEGRAGGMGGRAGGMGGRGGGMSGRSRQFSNRMAFDSQEIWFNIILSQNN